MAVVSSQSFISRPAASAEQLAALSKIKAVKDEKSAPKASESLSPVQQMLSRQKADTEKNKDRTNYFESEDYLRMKAFEIRQRIVLYQNLGLTQQYQQAQAEGQEVVKKYQALLKKASGGQQDTTA
jgi:hypothetical protein